MRTNDQKNSLSDYVRFLIAAPAAPALEPEMKAIRAAHQRLLACPVEKLGEESWLAMSLVELLYRLRDKKLKLGL